MKTWDEFREELRLRKQRVWADLLVAEPPGRPGLGGGRRPRDPEQEALMLELDRERVRRSRWLAGSHRVPVDPARDPGERDPRDPG